MIRYIARHGQVQQEQEYAGDPLYTFGECPLSALGYEQAHLLGKRMKALGFTGKIVASPLLRTMQTAEAVAEETGCAIYPFGPIHEYFPTLEWAQQYVGKTLEELRTLFPHIAPDAELPYPWWDVQVESDPDVVLARVKEGLDDLLTQPGFADCETLLIGHGASCNGMYRYFGFDTSRAFSYNCALSAIDPENPDFVPYCCDTGHIPYEKTTNNYRHTRAERDLSLFDVPYEGEIPLPDWLERCRGSILLHISDTDSANYPYYKKLIETVRPDILLHTGDMANEVKVGRMPETEYEYRTKIRWLLAQMDACSAKRILIVPGNNDLPDAIRAYCPRAEILPENEDQLLDGETCRLGHAILHMTWGSPWTFYGHGYTFELWHYDWNAEAKNGERRFNGDRHSHIVCLHEKRFFRIPDPV